MRATHRYDFSLGSLAISKAEDRRAVAEEEHGLGIHEAFGQQTLARAVSPNGHIVAVQRGEGGQAAQGVRPIVENVDPHAMSS